MRYLTLFAVAAMPLVSACDPGPSMDLQQTRVSRSNYVQTGVIYHGGTTYPYGTEAVTVHRFGKDAPDAPYTEYTVSLKPTGSAPGWVDSVACIPNSPAGCEATLLRFLTARATTPDGGSGGSGGSGGY